jgi:hypothetical protein
MFPGEAKKPSIGLATLRQHQNQGQGFVWPFLEECEKTV